MGILSDFENTEMNKSTKDSYNKKYSDIDAMEGLISKIKEKINNHRKMKASERAKFDEIYELDNEEIIRRFIKCMGVDSFYPNAKKYMENRVDKLIRDEKIADRKAALSYDADNQKLNYDPEKKKNRDLDRKRYKLDYITINDVLVGVITSTNSYEDETQYLFVLKPEKEYGKPKVLRYTKSGLVSDLIENERPEIG